MQSPPAPVEVTSFGTRAVNVLTAPGELYAEVALAPVQNSSWLIPYFLMVALIALMMFSFANNGAIYDQILTEQAVEMRAKVAAGEMTKEQADQAAQFMTSKGMFLTFGIVFATFAMSAIMFGAPLVFWLVSKGALQYSGGYKKMLEVYGLATVVGIVGTLVTIIMMNMMDSMYAQPGGAFLLMDSYDKENFGHNFLAAMNVFSIWQTAVVGLGLAAVSGKAAARGMAVSFGLWLVYVVCASFLGWGAR